MEIIFKSILYNMFLISVFLSGQTFAQPWDCQCLRDCFATNHDCNFCAYQCEASDKDCPLPVYDQQECPLCDDVNDP